MDIDREAIIEAVAAAVPVLIIIAVFMFIGSTFADGTLSPEGGEALVVAIVGFVFLMFFVGLYLSRIRPDGNGNANGS